MSKTPEKTLKDLITRVEKLEAIVAEKPKAKAKPKAKDSAKSGTTS